MTRTSDLEQRLERLEDNSDEDGDAPETFAEAIKQAVEEDNDQ